ncbi:MAG: hypothetical protein JWQ27_562 [Ferruginibacter sp.]|nr:hypothetical protein [Ferruginibacter sp.]
MHKRLEIKIKFNILVLFNYPLMTTKESLTWFKQTFSNQLSTATANTPFSIDLLSAIACQETGYIWSSMAGKIPLDQIALLAVGDTLDAPNRRAFPQTKAALLNEPGGAAMFTIARDCLVGMSKFITSYKPAASNPNKFCHGFGIFQYDLQHFKDHPDYFLKKKWADIDACFALCIDELTEAKKRQGWKSKLALTDEEKVYVAIAYNRGTANLSKGFKQGYQSPDGRFYGENIFEYMRMSAGIPVTGNAVTTNAGPAPLPPVTTVVPDKKIYEVKITSSSLNLRAEPRIPRDKPSSNIRAVLPNGHLVNLLSGKISDKWVEVDTSLNGGYFRGYVSSEFLNLVKTATSIPLVIPAVNNPTSGIMEVYMPRKAGTITKRTDPATAHSLNEPWQPVRKSNQNPDLLKADLINIISWLNVEKPSNKRYQSVNGSTFCNIYAHDYCFLAGVYLPRVWWTQSAIAKLAQNEPVVPLYGNTIEEMRANSLYRWLNDFGDRFGWRQTGDLNKLQNAANIGAVAIIIARRVQDGKSGHVTIVAPETEAVKAKRDAIGTVVAPVQSQAGVRNFNLSTGQLNWWLSEQFAAFSFWVHA